MQKIEYDRMADREKNYWWHVGRYAIIEKYMKLAMPNKGRKQKILNVGAGTGGTIPYLEKFGDLRNVDISSDAIKYLKKSGYKADKANGTKLPYKNNEFNVVCAFDILEHVEDDVDALREWARVLKPGGKIVLTVPAYQWLWSEHDVSLHHHRRHTRKTISNKAKAAGLKPKKLSYAIVFSLPLVVGFRFLNKILGRKVDSETSYVDVSDGINRLFTSFLKLEAKAHGHISYPAGTSVVAILEK